MLQVNILRPLLFFGKVTSIFWFWLVSNFHSCNACISCITLRSTRKIEYGINSNVKQCLGNHHVKHVMYKSHMPGIIYIPKNAIPSSNNQIFSLFIHIWGREKSCHFIRNLTFWLKPCFLAYFDLSIYKMCTLKLHNHSTFYLSKLQQVLSFFSVSASFSR